jgi:hypothetical protein
VLTDLILVADSRAAAGEAMCRDELAELFLVINRTACPAPLKQ